MENLVLGILTIIISLSIYIFAYISYRKSKFTKTLLLILLGGLCLRIYVASDQYLHKWDERYHALVAKNLIQHPLKPTLYDQPLFPVTPENWGANNVWLEKGPIPLWTIAASLRLFGTNEFVVRIPSILISLLAVYLTFLLGAKLFNKKVALLAAFLHSIHGLVLELAGGRISSDHVETFFIVFIELAVYLAVLRIKYKKHQYLPVLIGFATGLAFLSKWSPALIVFVVYLTGMLISDRFKLKSIINDLLLSVGSFLLLVLPWMIYIHYQFPNESSYVFNKFLFAFNQSIDGHKGPWYFYIHYIGITFGELIYLPLLFSLYFLVKRKPDYKWLMLTVWWLVPTIIFSFAVTKRHTYIMLAAPAFIIILSYYWFYFFEQRKNFKYPWLIYLLLIGLLASPVNFCITRTKALNKRVRDPLWAQELKHFAKNYQLPDKTVVFNLNHEIEAMYYTGFTVYQMMPDQHNVDRIRKLGYRILVNENNKTGHQKSRLKNVTYFSINNFKPE